jgi:hypothetical protein
MHGIDSSGLSFSCCLSFISNFLTFLFSFDSRKNFCIGSATMDTRILHDGKEELWAGDIRDVEIFCVLYVYVLVFCHDKGKPGPAIVFLRAHMMVGDLEYGVIS